ncbi:hypothetical protein L6452_37693 [Arctium lappa]|uniref:Uncharacterized protein n=1 Tax=Arctium lappa TaxID=4217 RepID=A0ACB8Y4E9_ARCLA|nr:hypothetical protein L6452_37693 [Arctium lappa]
MELVAPLKFVGPVKERWEQGRIDHQFGGGENGEHKKPKEGTRSLSFSIDSDFLVICTKIVLYSGGILEDAFWDWVDIDD